MSLEDVRIWDGGQWVSVQGPPGEDGTSGVTDIPPGTPDAPAIPVRGATGLGLYAVGTTNLVVAAGSKAVMTFAATQTQLRYTNFFFEISDTQVLMYDQRFASGQPQVGIKNGVGCVMSANNNQVVVSNTGVSLSSATGTIAIGGNTYPKTVGEPGQVLTTDGLGVLSWTTPSAGGGASLSGGSFSPSILLTGASRPSGLYGSAAGGETIGISLNTVGVFELSSVSGNYLGFGSTDIAFFQKTTSTDLRHSGNRLYFSNTLGAQLSSALVKRLEIGSGLTIGSQNDRANIVIDGRGSFVLNDVDRLTSFKTSLELLVNAFDASGQGRSGIRIKSPGFVNFASLSEAPTSSVEQGDLYYDSTSKKFLFYNGVKWDALGSGGASGVSADAGNFATIGSDGLIYVGGADAGLSHAPTHAIGGSDPLTPEDIGAAPIDSPDFTGIATFTNLTAGCPITIENAQSDSLRINDDSGVRLFTINQLGSVGINVPAPLLGSSQGAHINGTKSVQLRFTTDTTGTGPQAGLFFRLNEDRSVDLVNSENANLAIGTNRLSQINITPTRTNCTGNFNFSGASNTFFLQSINSDAIGPLNVAPATSVIRPESYGGQQVYVATGSAGTTVSFESGTAPIGTVMEFINLSTGIMTILASGGVSILYRSIDPIPVFGGVNSSCYVRGRNAGFRAIKVSTNSWFLSGELQGTPPETP